MDTNTDNDYQVILFYKFIKLDDPQALQLSQKTLCESLGLTGRLLIAPEGINGTFEGTPSAIESYIKTMHSDPRFSDVVFKLSPGTGQAFPKLKIKVRDEIVSLRADREIDPSQQTAKEITASELEAWYENDEDFVVLDLRNSYEIASGYFEKTVDPGLRNFRDFTDKLDELACDPRLKGKKIVPVCTGGIRCEKATCLMDDDRFPEVYQLKDGIHSYMEQYPNSHFKGSLFVFDNRCVVDLGAGDDREVVSACEFCDQPTEHYVNDDSKNQSEKILCCEECFQAKENSLRAFIA